MDKISILDLERQVVLNTVEAYWQVVNFVNSTDLSTRLMFIAMALTAAAWLVLLIFLWKTKGANMGKIRKRTQNRILADRICTLIEQLKQENVLTNEEADDRYRALAKAFRLPDLRPRPYRVPGQSTAKERLIERQLFQAFNGKDKKPTIPGPKPGEELKKKEAKKAKKLLVAKPNGDGEAKPSVTTKVFSFFKRQPAA